MRSISRLVADARHRPASAALPFHVLQGPPVSPKRRGTLSKVSNVIARTFKMVRSHRLPITFLALLAMLPVQFNSLTRLDPSSTLLV